MSRLELHLFGSPRIEINGIAIEVDTRKAIALVAYLAVTAETHQRDALANLLWPDYDQTNARAALRRTLSTLNRSLEGETGIKRLDITRESIGLAPGVDLWLDTREFRSRLASLASHGHAPTVVCPACVDALEAAARLYHEPFMAGFSLRDSPNFDEWQFFQEETLRRELSGALEKLAFGLSEQNRIEEAIQYTRRWLALDELLEDAHRQLMILFAQADQRNAALRQYRECVRILDQELGVEPLEETTNLYEAILNRGPIPDKGTRLCYQADIPQGMLEPGRSTPPQPAHPGARQAAAAQSGAGAVQSAFPLVGRTAEWQLLIETYTAVGQNAAPGHSNQSTGGMIALVGEAGIGKTRLAEELIAYAQSRGARTLQARCYAGETGLAYAPFLSGLGEAVRSLASDPAGLARLKSLPPAVLAEAARLLPDLAVVTPPSAAPAGSGEGAQARFFEAIRQVIIALFSMDPNNTPGRAPGLLFLDDLHWIDAASLDLLTYLARRLSGAGLILLAAWRDESGDTTQALDNLVGELKRAGQAVRVQLRRLHAPEVIDLVRARGGPNSADFEALGLRLFQESEGLPFVAVAYLAALAQPGADSSPEQRERWEMPASVRDLLRSRLAGLDSAAQQILSTAAVIGRSFDFNTLREVSARSEFETIDSLEKLTAADLIHEQAVHLSAPTPQSARTGEAGLLIQAGPTDIRYDFTHEKLRAMIYDETSLARRRLLHRRIAESLARPLTASTTPGMPEQAAAAAGLIAYHYQQAGMESQAADYHLLAGEQARRLFANTEALHHFQSALASGHPDQATLHEAIGDLYTLRGDYNAALHRYRTAAALCEPACHANLEHKLGNVHQRRGEWDLAESHYLASLESLDEDNPEPQELVFRVRLYSDRSLAAYSNGQHEQAYQFAARALELAQQSDDPYALAQANNMLGLLARAGGNHDQAIAHLETSLALADTLDDPAAQIAGLNNLARVYGDSTNPDRLERAVELARQALALCVKRGDRHRQAALHNNIADLFHRLGREEEAMEQLKQAVVLFHEIENETSPHQDVEAAAGIWKLTEW